MPKAEATGLAPEQSVEAPLEAGIAERFLTTRGAFSLKTDCLGEASERGFGRSKREARRALRPGARIPSAIPLQPWRLDSSMASHIGGAGRSQKPSIHWLLPPALWFRRGGLRGAAGAAGARGPHSAIST